MKRIIFMASLLVLASCSNNNDENNIEPQLKGGLISGLIDHIDNGTRTALNDLNESTKTITWLGSDNLMAAWNADFATEYKGSAANEGKGIGDFTGKSVPTTVDSAFAWYGSNSADPKNVKFNLPATQKVVPGDISTYDQKVSNDFNGSNSNRFTFSGNLSLLVYTQKISGALADSLATLNIDYVQFLIESKGSSSKKTDKIAGNYTVSIYNNSIVRNFDNGSSNSVAARPIGYPNATVKDIKAYMYVFPVVEEGDIINTLAASEGGLVKLKLRTMAPTNGYAGGTWYSMSIVDTTAKYVWYNFSNLDDLLFKYKTTLSYIPEMQPYMKSINDLGCSTLTDAIIKLDANLSLLGKQLIKDNNGDGWLRFNQAVANSYLPKWIGMISKLSKYIPIPVDTASPFAN